MLEVLRERGATATFFLVGEQVERYPALVAEIVAAGHGVELHCFRHRNLCGSARVPSSKTPNGRRRRSRTPAAGRSPVTARPTGSSAP